MLDSLAASPSPAAGPSGHSKRRAFTHSGGTAPDSHRTSLLCPRGHPRQDAILAQSTLVHASRRPGEASSLRNVRKGTDQNADRASASIQRFKEPLHNGRTAAATRHRQSGSIDGVGRRFQPFRINNLEMVAQIFPQMEPNGHLAEGSGALLLSGLRPAPRS